MERAGKKNGNNKDWQFWQQDNNPMEIKDQEMFDRTLDYKHQNLPTGRQVQWLQAQRSLQIGSIGVHWIHNKRNGFIKL